MTERPASQTKVKLVSYGGGITQTASDKVVTEEPLEIRVSAARSSQTVAVTMRTPGNDFELAAGFLFSEGVIASGDDIATISYCRDDDLPPEQLYNIVIVELRDGDLSGLDRLQRHFQISSSCGVCGKADIEAIEMRGCQPVADGPQIEPATVLGYPESLRQAQALFGSTGGLHAAGLFHPGGPVVVVREDVGRHNAVDKVIGRMLLDGALPAHPGVLVVSGRSSFEILQKAAVAGIPVVCSVSAPSSLAIQVAETFGITLVGFLRGDRFNIYSSPERIRTG